MLDFKLARKPQPAPAEPERIYDLIIIGGGPAGLTAGLYSARAGLATLLVEKRIPGGQASTTSQIENCPGCIEGSGPEIMAHLLKQSLRFGLQVLYAEVNAVDLGADPKIIVTTRGEHKSRAVVIATGASPTELDIPGEKEFRGKGVSFCATCDGPFFRDKTVAVIGGGDSALKEGDYLSRFAEKVIIFHRRDDLRAERALQKRVMNNPKMEIRKSASVESIVGDKMVKAIRVRDLPTGDIQEIPVDGVFIYVGMCPNSDLVKGILEMDASGYLITDDAMETSMPGVFVAGDVRQTVLRQVVTAMSDGAIAATTADHWLHADAAEMREAGHIG